MSASSLLVQIWPHVGVTSCVGFLKVPLAFLLRVGVVINEKHGHVCHNTVNFYQSCPLIYLRIVCLSLLKPYFLISFYSILLTSSDLYDLYDLAIREVPDGV
jgi:hypothetical protein